MNGPLEREFEYFLQKREEFAEKHDGKFVAIKNQEVIGVYADYLEASSAVYTDHEYGTVLMQEVQKDEESLKVVLHSPHVTIE